MSTPRDAEGTAAARLLRELVNSREPQVGADNLDSPAELAEWWEQQGLPTGRGRLTRRHLEQVVEVREGLRAAFLGHAGHELAESDVAAVSRLNAVLSEFPLTVALEGDGYTLTPVGHQSMADPLAGPMAGVADAIRRCHEDGSWLRLKVCARDTCRWAFFDSSRNQVRRWCSMAGCGNHVKMKRAYARRRSDVG